MSVPGFICTFVVDAFWQSSLLVMLAWIVLYACRTANATTRYTVWLGVVVASLVLPLATTAATMPRLGTATPITDAFRVHPSIRSTEVDDSTGGRAQALTPTGAPPARFLRVRYTLPAVAGTIVTWTWGVVAAVLLVRLALSLLHIEGLKRDALPLAPERRARLTSWGRAHRGRRDVRLCVSDSVRIPTAIGLFDAMILIPNDLEQQLDATDLDRIVLHELAHLRRRDDWSNALAQTVRSLLFFSPAVAFAAAQLELEREVACDDSVLLADPEALTYANTLARMTDIVAWPHRPLAAPGLFMTRRGMSIRIERILEDGRDVRARLSPGPAVLAACAIAAIALTATIAPAIALTPAENPTVTATPIEDAAPADISYTGTWALKYYKALREIVGSKALLFDLHYPSGSSDWTVPADLKSLGIDPRRLRAANGPIAFTIKRDAGTFECTGEAGAGVGHGEFRFQPNPEYAATFGRLGIKLPLRDQVVAGMANIPLSYLQGLDSMGMTPMSFQSLISLKMFVGSLDKVRATRREFPGADVQEITTLAMMQDRARYAGVLHALFPAATIDEIMSMAMVGVTPSYVDMLRKAEVRGLSANNVTALRSTGVDQAFVERMIAAGKTHLTIDEVVALKQSGF